MSVAASVRDAVAPVFAQLGSAQTPFGTIVTGETKDYEDHFNTVRALSEYAIGRDSRPYMALSGPSAERQGMLRVADDILAQMHAGIEGLANGGRSHLPTSQ